MSAKILIADDEEQNRKLLSYLVEVMGHVPILAADGAEALEQVIEARPHLILLDMEMPRVTGDEVLRRLKAHPEHRYIPVVVISGLSGMDDIVPCIRAGADDYMVKPFVPELLKARIGALLDRVRLREVEQEHRRLLMQRNDELQRQIQDAVRQTTAAHLATTFALVRLAESRDPETGGHLERIGDYCRILAETLVVEGPPEYRAAIDDRFLNYFEHASALHDIGKVAIPDRILLKPGRLTSEEYAVMKTHARIGADTLRQIDRKAPGNPVILLGIDIAERHHERWDGTGYPDGQIGTEIPLSARIMALADVYDALSTPRCYKDAFSHETCLKIITEGRGTQFDPEIVDVFFAHHKRFQRISAR